MAEWEGVCTVAGQEGVYSYIEVEGVVAYTEFEGEADIVAGGHTVADMVVGTVWAEVLGGRRELVDNFQQDSPPCSLDPQGEVQQ